MAADTGTRLLDGAVAVVTGAGRGLGRAEALELASHGAAVVVNDHDPEPANEVADLIAERGGSALAHHGDVGDFGYAERLISDTIAEFGDLNILVNNAGILRDRLIFNMTEEEWDSVVRVHLKGHFNTSRWATAYWRGESKRTGGEVYGRVINTASEAFLSGSVLQPNYAAAKAGIAALTLSTAKACAKYGVTANVICPRAQTRLTEHLDGFGGDAYAPGHVARVVAALATRAAGDISGQVVLAFGPSLWTVAAPQATKELVVDQVSGVPGLVEDLLEHLQGSSGGFAMRAPQGPAG